MEELLINAFDLVVLSTNEYANVLEQTTELLESLRPEKEQYQNLLNDSDLVKAKLKELELAEERLYNAQRNIEK